MILGRLRFVKNALDRASNKVTVAWCSMSSKNPRYRLHFEFPHASRSHRNPRELKDYL